MIPQYQKHNAKLNYGQRLLKQIFQTALTHPHQETAVRNALNSCELGAQLPNLWTMYLKQAYTSKNNPLSDHTACFQAKEAHIKKTLAFFNRIIKEKDPLFFEILEEWIQVNLNKAYNLKTNAVNLFNFTFSDPLKDYQLKDFLIYE